LVGPFFSTTVSRQLKKSILPAKTTMWSYLWKGTLSCRTKKISYSYQRLGYLFSHILRYLFRRVAKVSLSNSLKHHPLSNSVRNQKMKKSW